MVVRFNKFTNCFNIVYEIHNKLNLFSAHLTLSNLWKSFLQNIANNPIPIKLWVIYNLEAFIIYLKQQMLLLWSIICCPTLSRTEITGTKIPCNEPLYDRTIIIHYWFNCLTIIRNELFSCGGGTRTPDHKVMSLISYHCSTPHIF